MYPAVWKRFPALRTGLARRKRENGREGNCQQNPTARYTAYRVTDIPSDSSVPDRSAQTAPNRRSTRRPVRQAGFYYTDSPFARSWPLHCCPWKSLPACGERWPHGRNLTESEGHVRVESSHPGQKQNLVGFPSRLVGRGGLPRIVGTAGVLVSM
ncbi:hypothetical protein VTN96DRAFT_8049 [Rasamsonia emersonii]